MKDSFNPLQTAKFLADFKNAMGENTTVAQEYSEFENFDVNQYLADVSLKSLNRRVRKNESKIVLLTDLM